MKLSVPRGENLVKLLQRELSQSGKAVRRMLEASLCRVNGKVERFGSSFVERGDLIEIAPNWEKAFSFSSSKIEILYENEDFKIVDKPKGVACEKGSSSKFFGKGSYLVHRLDKETTGALLIAKNLKAQKELELLFSERKIEKKYLALVDGHLREKKGTIENFLAKKRSYQGQAVWGASFQGQKAVTHFEVLKEGILSSLVLCTPVTGRTHQIRVHMAEMGHPILVDRQYAKTFRSPLFASRYLLHAHLLEFSYQGQKVSVTAPIPLDMKEAFKALKIQG